MKYINKLLMCVFFIIAINSCIYAEVDFNQKDKDGNTPLHEAVSNGEYNSVHMMISTGVNINAKNKNGWTPLSIAKKIIIINLLINYGSK